MEYKLIRLQLLLCADIILQQMKYNVSKHFPDQFSINIHEKCSHLG